ncbi:uncharacterized protein BDR25DRAFT_325701 [Lindgomyces ingoldianus]|uniref:Uncharacterized protein n=1 Tax=Lindgomyces ingoldianus TaxID=673940 RepID=A0ACB6QU14_9PLEO|nr:uncharacterized protein BDR25DRAFT_325701 [Lindgomyces ingoldianus]KAF2470509.1 hypothetical protein BDR25DRAFT_325701 [Lindgomyces ingoldianus]
MITQAKPRLRMQMLRQNLLKLLNFVAKNSSVFSCVKWAVSSGNWPNIEEQLERANHKVRLSLKVNAESVSTAVQTFIKQKISKSDNANLCKQVLVSIGLVYRLITLKELVTLIKQLGEITNNKELHEIIGLWGSLLILREDTIYFVHQSAKDFLLAQAAKEVFPSRREDVYSAIVARSLEIMSRTLQYPVNDFKQPYSDLIATSRYSCIYWVDYFCDSNAVSLASHAKDLLDRGVIDLEALSLCKSVLKGVASMAKLRSLVQACPQQAF